MDISSRRQIISIMDALRTELAGEYFRNAGRDLHAQDLSLTAFSLLMLLSRDGPLTVGRLAGELGRSQPATSRLADRLVQRHLLVRQPVPGDRRARRLALSARGRALLAAYEKRHSTTHVRLFELLTPEELRRVLDAFSLLGRALERARARRAATGSPLPPGEEA
jgi:DNA-binding MarR family transcriptional regulator